MDILSAKSITSPDNRREARLLPAGRGPWDETHARLVLADRSFGSRIFGWHGVWSPCSRYFAITEWRRAEVVPCSDMHLLVIDVQEGRQCVVERVECGFVEPMSFHKNEIRYNKIAKGMDERSVVHLPVEKLTDWKPLADHPLQLDS